MKPQQIKKLERIIANLEQLQNSASLLVQENREINKAKSILIDVLLKANTQTNINKGQNS